jgi:hypothetical protein
MGLFGKKQLSTCPICGTGMEEGVSNTMAHCASHVLQIPPGYGDLSGQWTWECVCGPADMIWPHDIGAAAGLALHLQQRHGIPL